MGQISVKLNSKKVDIIFERLLNGAIKSKSELITFCLWYVDQCLYEPIIEDKTRVDIISEATGKSKSELQLDMLIQFQEFMRQNQNH